MLRAGQTLTASLENLKRQDYARLAGSIHEVSSADLANKKEIVNSRDELLIQLHKSQYSLPIKNINEHPAALHLVNKDILFTDGMTIQPQYRPVEHAIKAYLRLFEFIIE